MNWLLEPDIRGFFDSIDPWWLIKFIEHRIAGQRAIRRVRKGLKARVLEEGRNTVAEEGVSQSGTISPLLANICLLYVLGLPADRWRRRRARVM